MLINIANILTHVSKNNLCNPYAERWFYGPWYAEVKAKLYRGALSKDELIRTRNAVLNGSLRPL